MKSLFFVLVLVSLTGCKSGGGAGAQSDTTPIESDSEAPDYGLQEFDGSECVLQNEVQSSNRLIVFGDDSASRYASGLATALSMDLSNQAVQGSTSSCQLANVRNVTIQDTDTIVFLAGFNDYRINMDEDEFQDYMGRIRTHFDNSNAEIVIITPYTLDDYNTDAPFNQGSAMQAYRMRQVITTVFNSPRHIIVDAFTDFEDSDPDVDLVNLILSHLP